MPNFLNIDSSTWSLHRSSSSSPSSWFALTHGLSKLSTMSIRVLVVTTAPWSCLPLTIDKVRYAKVSLLPLGLRIYLFCLFLLKDIKGNDFSLDGVTKIDGSQIPPTGLGIQENGMYCRCCGNEGGCINPDNAGLQLVINKGNCKSYKLNDPFYCGKHPPNAKNFVNVKVGGRWPNCEVTLTRKSNAPRCQNSC